MKKGFTLVELLIVMVIVGILVTVALPKYYASMEHGRSMEGITNLKAASEALNSRYIINANQYTCNGVVTGTEFVVAGASTGNFTRQMYFGAPQMSSCTFSDATVGPAEITITRNGPEPYTLTAHNENGELQYITCVGGAGAAANICENVGAEWNTTLSAYTIDFGH